MLYNMERIEILTKYVLIASKNYIGPKKYWKNVMKHGTNNVKGPALCGSFRRELESKKRVGI